MRTVFALAPLSAIAGIMVAFDSTPRPPASCTRTSGLNLPEGFCAVVVAENLGRARQLTVLPNGDVLAALTGGGGVVALRDTDADGRADVRKAFGDEGGTGIGYHDGAVWFAPTSGVLRWRWTLGDLAPRGAPEVIVEGLPTSGHSAKTFAFLGGDSLIVNIGSETNSCQLDNRSNRSPGRDPCEELAGRAGLWRFSTGRQHQREQDGERFATGLRNAEALAVHPETGKLFAAPHGRDQLAQNWGYSEALGAELPAEELVQVEPGDDFGWPYCYFDQQQGKKVLSPEYGGDGSTIGRCASKKAPLIGFPGHWAPMAIAFYDGKQFPAKYSGGAFIAFHGSWNRAPLPQQGFRVAFVPFAPNGRPSGGYETFATSQKGETGLRASGVAVGPDGSLYIADEASGTVWRVMAQSAGK